MIRLPHVFCPKVSSRYKGTIIIIVVVVVIIIIITTPRRV
jgi:hypothetical protein